ncbi:hypothetical protein B983_01167 [Brucella abortus 67/93]|nr:hypothetical protein C079_01387 [Brucella abortus 65/157]ENR83133.1 hypothetical protein B983_01167 [Brucella abortus 67/93]
MEKGGGESLKLRSFVLTRIFSENRFTLFGMRSHAAYVTIRARKEAECRAIKNPGRSRGRNLHFLRKRSAGNGDVHGLGAFSTTIWFRFIGNLLIVSKAWQARSLNCRNMHEDVRAAIIGLDETETFFGVEEFDLSGLCHGIRSFSLAPPLHEKSAELHLLSSAPHTRQRVMQAVLDIGKELIIASDYSLARNL